MRNWSVVVGLSNWSQIILATICRRVWLTTLTVPSIQMYTDFGLEHFAANFWYNTERVFFQNWLLKKCPLPVLTPSCSVYCGHDFQKRRWFRTCLHSEMRKVYIDKLLLISQVNHKTQFHNDWLMQNHYSNNISKVIFVSAVYFRTICVHSSGLSHSCHTLNPDVESQFRL